MAPASAILRYLICLPVLALLSAGAHGRELLPRPLDPREPSDCEILYADLPPFGTELKPEDVLKLRERFKTLTQRPTTRLERQHFLATGWPELVQLAHERGKQPIDLVREAHELTRFWKESRPFSASEAAAIERTLTEAENRIRWFSQRVPPETKPLSSAEVDAVDRIVKTLQRIAYLATESEQALRGTTSINPLRAPDGRQLRQVFTQLKNSGEEGVLALVTNKTKPRIHVVANGEPAPAPIPVADTRPAPKAPHPEPPARVDQPLALKNVLAADRPLAEGQLYQFEDYLQDTYRIRFEREVIKEAEKGHDREIRKLLSSVFLGNGSQAGFRRLTDVGKNIIEIKVVLRGHKRLIGCLKGRELIIKKFLELPPAKAAYRRLIPTHLCDE